MIFNDLGIIEYKAAWDHQESLLQKNLRVKSAIRSGQQADDSKPQTTNIKLQTSNYFLLCEHPPVYTLGKSGKKEHVLMNDAELAAQAQRARRFRG